MAHRIDRANVVAVPTNARLHRRLDPEPLRVGLHRRAQAPPVGARRHRRDGAEHGRAREPRSTSTATPGTASSSPARRTGSPAAPAGTRTSAIGQQGGPWEKHWSLYYYEDMTADRVTGGDLAAGSVKSHFLTQGPHRLPRLRPRLGVRSSCATTPRATSLAKLKDRARGVLHPVGRPVPDRRAPDRRRPRRRPRLPAVVEGRLERRVRPGRRAARRLADRPRALVGDEPHPADQHALHVEAAQRLDPRDRHRRHGGQGRRQGEPVRHRATATRSTAAAGRRRSARAFVLYHLAKGRHHTIYARAYRRRRERDQHVAKYTFYVTPGALG